MNMEQDFGWRAKSNHEIACASTARYLPIRARSTRCSTWSSRKPSALSRVSWSEYERYAFLAASSIYGVELLQDNVEECRKRLFEFIKGEAEKTLKSNLEPAFLDAVAYVLERNILCGDALTLKANDGTLTAAYAEDEQTFYTTIGDQILTHIAD